MKALLLFLIINLSICAAPLQQLQHAKIYKDQNISGWMMSEKLDGIRGYWDGKAFYSKGGKKLSPPTNFTKNFPSFALDGELWSKRQDFETIQSKVLKHESQWKGISYNVFEVPNAQGDFFTRLNRVKKWFKEHPNSHVHIIPQYICKGTNHLNNYVNEIVARGGEGAMVKDPTLNYIAGRTSAILKVKQAQDMEGKIIAINYQRDGTCLKSLTMQLDNGVVFKLGNGFSKKARKNPPPIDTLVTFKYYGFTKLGKPKFASFMRVRQALN